MKGTISILIFLLFLFIPWFNGGKETVPLTIIQITVLIAGLLCLQKNRYFPFHKSSRLNFPLEVFVFFCFLSVIRSIYLYNSLLGFINILILIILYHVFVYSSTEALNEKLFRLIFVLSFIFSIANNRFPNQNLLAGYLVIGIVIGLTRVMVKLKDWLYDKKYRNIALYLIPILIMFLRLVLTHSRAGYLSLAAAVIFLFLIRNRKWGVAVVSVILILLLIIVPSSKIKRVLKLDSTDPYANQRANIWKSTIDMISEHPVSGVGLGNFEYGFFKHNFPVSGAFAQYGKHAGFAHNEYLQLGAEAGLIPLFILVWIIWVFFTQGIKKLYVIESNKRLLWHFLSSLTGVVVILIHALVDFNLHLPAISMVFVFFVSVVMQKEERKEIRCIPGISIAFYLVLFFMLSVIIIDFTAYNFARAKDWKNAVRFSPINARYYKMVGDTVKSRKEKLSAYKKMVLLHPHESFCHKKLGDFYYSIEPPDLINALKEYKLALKYNPFNPFILFSIATYYFNQGEFRKALSKYKEVLLVEPHYVHALYCMGECYWNLDEKDKAKQQYDKTLKLKYMIPFSRRIHTDYEDILIDFDYALSYNSLGKYWMGKRNPDQAVVYYRKAMEINPDFAEVYNNIAGIYFAKKSYSVAVMYISKALELDPSNGIYMKNMRMIVETKSQVEK